MPHPKFRQGFRIIEHPWGDYLADCDRTLLPLVDVKKVVEQGSTFTKVTEDMDVEGSAIRSWIVRTDPFQRFVGRSNAPSA